MFRSPSKSELYVWVAWRWKTEDKKCREEAKHREYVWRKTKHLVQIRLMDITAQAPRSAIEPYPTPWSKHRILNLIQGLADKNRICTWNDEGTDQKTALHKGYKRCIRLYTDTGMYLCCMSTLLADTYEEGGFRMILSESNGERGTWCSTPLSRRLETKHEHVN